MENLENLPVSFLGEYQMTQKENLAKESLILGAAGIQI